ncbi:hypothetical protein RRG08_064566 [Elysia crispata]|uniref:Uncharacterized protein n=1 Tax=Elysia crispata TaxID=231223 RepID=A0AAE1BB35_9GAST|nr:hypothetical protein RRG08_064566 [Elysia crispata]
MHVKHKLRRNAMHEASHFGNRRGSGQRTSCPHPHRLRWPPITQKAMRWREAVRELCASVCVWIHAQSNEDHDASTDTGPMTRSPPRDLNHLH